MGPPSDAISDYGVNNFTDVLYNLTSQGTTNLHNSEANCDTDVSDVRYPFHIIAVGSIISALPFLVMFFITGPSVKPKSYFKTHRNKDEPLQKEMSSGKSALQYALLVSISILCYFYYCYTYLPLALLSTFVIQGLNWSVSEGPIQQSCFTGAVAVGRILSIPLAYYVSPKIMIPLLTLTSTASYITLAFSQTLNEVVIRVCIITAGLGSSSMQSFTLLWLSQYVSINSFIGALLLMASSVSGFSAAYLVGYLMEYNHMWFVYVCIVSCIMVMVCYVIMNIIVKICYVENTECLEKEVMDKALENTDGKSILDSHKSLARLRREQVDIFASQTSIC